MPRSSSRASSRPTRAHRRAVRRVDRLLRQRRAARAGARRQGDLSPQRSDPARLLAAASARRDLPLSRGGALGHCCARRSPRRACPASPRPGRTRSAMRGSCSRSRSTSVIPATPSRPGHIATMCHIGAYCGRYTIVVDDDIDVSNLEEVIWALLTRSDPADLDRHHPQRLVDAARSAHRARAQGGRRLHQQPGGDRCLPAVSLARQVPGRERAVAGAAAIALQKFGHLFKS